MVLYAWRPPSEELPLPIKWCAALSSPSLSRGATMRQVSRPSRPLFNLSRCLAGSSLRIAGSQLSAHAPARSGHLPVAAPFPARAVSRQSIRASPSKGLVRKQVAPAFSARVAIALDGESRDENERQAVSLGKQVGLQIEAAHGRHSDIRYHARCVIQVGRSQELLGRRECMDDVAKRPDEIVGGGANGAIIVDDRNYWWVGQSGPSWSARPEVSLAAQPRDGQSAPQITGRKIILRFAARRMRRAR